MSKLKEAIDLAMRAAQDVRSSNTRLEKALAVSPERAAAGVNLLQDGRSHSRIYAGHDGASSSLEIGNMPGLADGAGGFLPAGGRAKRLGYEKYWRAMCADHSTQFAQKVGWNYGKEGQPRDVIEKAGFRSVQKAWGVHKASLAEGQGQTGGYAVPTQFYADLLRLMGEKAFLREHCTVLPMQSRSLLVPALKQSSSTFSRGQSQFYGGVVMSWNPEAASIPESDPVFREIELTARDLTFITVASNQLLQDNAVSLDVLLTTLFQEAAAWSYDWYILNGQAGNEPQGILTAPGTFVLNRNTANHVYLPDIATMLAHLYTQSWDSAFWVAHPSLIPELMQMTTVAQSNQFLVWLAASGDPKANEGPVAMPLPARLAGLPVYWTEKVNKLGNNSGDLVLCDASKYLVGDRLAIQIEVSPHVNFTKNQMTWRCILRWDGTPWQDSPVTLADTSWQVSPFVRLQ